MSKSSLILAAGALLALTACPAEKETKTSAPVAAAQPSSKKASPAPEPPATEKSPPKPAGKKPEEAGREEARALYTNRCATCHGPNGAGDGPAAVALNPRPRALSDAAWQKSVDDAHIAKVIVKGGEAVGLSVMMAPNPDLADKPAVVTGLVEIIRGFSK